MSARVAIAKVVEMAGLGVVGLALFIGLRTADMGRELTLLAAGAVVFLVGYAIEPRPK